MRLSRGYMHTTERCYQLKNLIKDKIQSVQLIHFIQEDNATHHEDRDRDLVIDVISRGHAAGGIMKHVGYICLNIFLVMTTFASLYPESLHQIV